jgi:hypothetical protein
MYKLGVLKDDAEWKGILLQFPVRSKKKLGLPVPADVWLCCADDDNVPEFTEL